jgi:hypothetical protein
MVIDGLRCRPRPAVIACHLARLAQDRPQLGPLRKTRGSRSSCHAGDRPPWPEISESRGEAAKVDPGLLLGRCLWGSDPMGHL